MKNNLQINFKKEKFMRVFFILLLGVTLSFATKSAEANNLTFDNFQVYEVNESANTITYSCDITWENSWRTVTNFDAVWVFLKYSTDGGVTWSHASMAGNGVNPIGFSVSPAFEMLVPSDEKGFFLQRTEMSSGNVSLTGARFVWDYAQDGLNDQAAMAANTVNKIFGIEMVYVPQGAFYAGDDNSNSDYRFRQGGSDDEPWYIQNEQAITTTNGAADGYYYSSTGASGESSSGSVFLIPTSFPKGYQSFYMMKYELTEGQWVRFFNTLTNVQKANRDLTSSSAGGKNSDGVVNRNTIAWDSSDPKTNATTSRPARPVSYLSWLDLLAYADWAGLRPITELEFEKAARGKDITPLANELAWGRDSATMNGALSTEITPNGNETGTEAVFDGGANINNNNLSWTTGDGRSGGSAANQKGPLRVGIFAESSTNRASSGAGYYGSMELSGNLSEMVVTVGRAEGRQFLGTHGDGILTSLSGYEGHATNSDWPGINSSDAARGVTSTKGSGFRGGDFQSNATKYFQVSNRTNAVKDPDSQGFNQRYDSTFGVFGGGRLGRTAP